MVPDRWTRAAVVLVTLAATVFLLEKALQVGSAFADILLLFALAWLVAFILDPAVDLLGRRLDHTWATVSVYISILAGLLLLALLVTPLLILQLSQLREDIPRIVADMPSLIAFWQGELERFGVAIDLESLLQEEGLIPRVQTLSTELLQALLAAVATVLTVGVNLFLVVILSFYMTLDRHRLSGRMQRYVPPRLHDEIDFFASTIDRVFGGFVRGQVIQALIFAAGVLVVAWVFGLGFAILLSLISAVLMLIPLVGLPLALVPPILLAFPQSAGTAIWVAAILLVYQQAIVNLLMPRILSSAVGIHPLLIFAALLLGIKVGGIWGVLFSIPVAAVIYAMGIYLYDRFVLGRPEEPLPTPANSS
ncbi:MAG: AI-2E family transporter [Anaerolineae bacterium]